MIVIGLIVFVAAMIQGLLGFGGALIAMPLLVATIGINTAAPLFALVSALATLLNAIRWRDYATPRDLVQLIIPAVVGIPLGILLLSRVDSHYVTVLLGVILIVYAGYNLLGWVMPPATHPGWAYLAGFSSGILSGAFNTGGPPVIVFASTRQWTAERFRANLQTYFLVISLFVLAAHGLSGNLTTTVWQTALLAAPALVLGQLAGARLCRHVDAKIFRKLVLLSLILLGAQLVFQ